MVYRASYYVDSANLFKYPEVELINIKLHYDPPDGDRFANMSFWVSVNNVTDERYIGSLGIMANSLGAGGIQNGPAVLANTTGLIYPGMPRTVYGGVRVRF